MGGICRKTLLMENFKGRKSREPEMHAKIKGFREV
jgi:hypothetical protein